MDNPSVFISYSHDGKQHESWVLKLATHLYEHEVDVTFDQWDLRLGADLRFFMEQGLSSSRLVICICSENYVYKVDHGRGGAGYEAMIMTQPLLQNANQDFIIPVVRNNHSDHKVPLAFGSKDYVDFSDDSQYLERYTELIERIYGEDQKKRPLIRKNPFTPDLSMDIAVKTNQESVLYHTPDMDGSVTFPYDNNNGKYTIGNGEYAFETRWSRAGNNSIHAYGRIGYLPGYKDIPAKEKLIDFDYSSRVRTVKTGEIVIFENSYHKFVAVKVGKVMSGGHGNPYDQMAFDYHIYNVD